MQRTPSALLHLPFYKRFDSKSIPWKITDNLHTFRVVLPILIITIIKYPFTGPKRPEWTFLYHIVISVLSGYLSAFRTKIPDVVGSQRRNSRPSAIPKTTDLKIEFFERNQSVMKHFSNLVLEAPELVNEHGKVYGEWLFPIDCNKQNVIFYLHGGAYVTGSCQMGRGFVNRIGSASNAAIFSINYRLAPQKLLNLK